MTVHSVQLAFGEVALANTLTDVYTVPANTRTIVKTIRVSNVGAAAMVVLVNVKPAGTGRRLWAAGSIGSGASGTDTGWHVLNAGEKLQLFVSVAASCDYVISGTELAL